MTLTVGQKLWYVPNHGEAHEITVSKVGRKLATCGEGRRAIRINMETLWADGGSYTPPGIAYLDKAAYELTVERQNNWDKFRRILGCTYHVPASLTNDRILQLIREFERKIA